MSVVNVTLECHPDGRPKAYCLTNAYPWASILKSYGAKWNPSRRVWTLSLSTDLSRLSRRVPLQIQGAAREFQEELTRRLETLKALHTAEDADVRFGEGLDPYQRVGVKFLATAGSAVLGDDLGLGKTAQAIRACLEVGARRVLVVTKKSLLTQWEREIGRWTAVGESKVVLPPNFGVARLTAASKTIPNTPWVVTNYEAVVRHVDRLMPAGFDAMIVDEATAIKNRKAQRTKVIHKLARVIPHRLLLTGTPIHNRPDELWSLLHAVAPDTFTSYWRWVEEHCQTWRNPWGGVDILGVKDRHRLSQVLYPYLLRRTKSLLNLPPISHETVSVELTAEQRRVYRELRTLLMSHLGDEHIVVTPTVLSQLTRLRQVCCTPALIGGKDASTKTEALVDLLEEYAPHHKVLVFTTFAEYVRLLLPALRQWNPAHITGDLSTSRRDAEVHRFSEDPTCRILLGTITAMGEGLNLQAADVVVFLNREWVPAWNEQAVGRAYRRGQTKPVHIINLVCRNTVEEHVEKLLSAKAEVVREVDLAARLLDEMRRVKEVR